MINSEKYPKLFSIIFGEGINFIKSKILKGMVNDSVAIILYNTVNLYATTDKKIEWYFTF